MYQLQLYVLFVLAYGLCYLQLIVREGNAYRQDKIPMQELEPKVQGGAYAREGAELQDSMVIFFQEHLNPKQKNATVISIMICASHIKQCKAIRKWPSVVKTRIWTWMSVVKVHKRQQGTGGRVHTRHDRDHVKRQQETSEQGESRAQTRRERAGVFLPLDAISFLPCLIVSRGNKTSKQGKARLQSRQIAREGNENYISVHIYTSLYGSPTPQTSPKLSICTA